MGALCTDLAGQALSNAKESVGMWVTDCPANTQKLRQLLFSTKHRMGQQMKQDVAMSAKVMAELMRFLEFECMSALDDGASFCMGCLDLFFAASWAAALRGEKAVKRSHSRVPSLPSPSSRTLFKPRDLSRGCLLNRRHPFKLLYRQKCKFADNYWSSEQDQSGGELWHS